MDPKTRRLAREALATVTAYAAVVVAIPFVVVLLWCIDDASLDDARERASR